MRYIELLSKHRRCVVISAAVRHALTYIAAPRRVLTFDKHLFFPAVKRPTIELERDIGVIRLVAFINAVPLAEPHMAVIRPCTVVYTDDRYAERLNVYDIIVIGEQAAAASVGYKLQAIHVRVDRKRGSGFHLLQCGVYHPGMCSELGKRQVCIQQHFLCHVVKGLFA